MSDFSSLKKTHFLYESKTLFPLLLSLALIAGLFQNCSSKFGEGQDPISIQKEIEAVAPLYIKDGAVKVSRLEGTALQVAVEADLFSDQGKTSCPNAQYTWSYLSNASNATQTPLVQSGPNLQFNQLKLSDEGSYFLNIDCEGQNYQLGPVELDVVPTLKLGNNSVTNQTVTEGSPANLRADFSGPNPISYQWYFQPKKGDKIALAGQTEQEFYIINAQISDQGLYSLEAISTEAGILQNETAGPGRLTVLPISSIAGSVSGTTKVKATEPIYLTSSVSGATSPTYQWYFNSVVISGAVDPNYEIPVSQPTDSGTYSLVVEEQGKTFQIGSVNVVVYCAPGQVLVGGVCYANSKSCTVDDGVGVQFIDSAGVYGECKITTCDPGFVNVSNTCVPAKTECSVENGTGLSTFGISGQPGRCIVQSCDQGYININNICQRRVCSVENGVGLIEVQGADSVCKVEYCNNGFVKNNNKCVPRVQSCPKPNGYGTVEYTESGPGECRVKSCYTGYVNIQNSCVKRDCSVSNGTGIIALSPSGSIQCRAVSCNSGFFLSNNTCISQTCNVGQATGYWTSVSGNNICSLTSCNSAGLVLINNQCVPSACSVPNGQGSVAIDINNQTYCKAISCNSGFVIKGNVCASTSGGACSVQNGSGTLINNGQTCSVSSCNSGYVPYQNKCVAETQTCQVSNGTGTQNFTTSGPGQCHVQTCDAGYVQQGNQCVQGNQSCSIENGVGYRDAYANGFSQCRVKSCNIGYGPTITEQCLPLKRSCYVGSGHGFQYLTSYGYSACQIETCAADETMLMGVCRPDERLLCEPMDVTKDAEGGKVYGYLYSLLKHKHNANLNTATLSSNRLNGHVFLKSMYFDKPLTNFYDSEDQLVGQPDGTALKNWFGLSLFSQIMPPDGAYSGDYFLALASDDGSSLDCKVDGSWRNFVDNSSANSCNNIKTATLPIRITRNKPMPIRVKYFQNSGGGRCLKLMYKKAGASGPFQVIPESKLILPDGTINNCRR
jgi:hypothetical protein